MRVASARWVAESDTGQITEVAPWDGSVGPVYRGLPTPQGIDLTARGGSWIVTAGAEPPEDSESPPPPPSAFPSASLLYVDRWIGEIKVVADLEAYELANNPDGQRHFGDDGVPLDSVSNPFYVLTRPGGVLVADGGANDVLSVSAAGEIRTLFVPPLVTTGACAAAVNNDPSHVGCDPVPTGLAWGPDGALYVSTLSAGVPGQGVVYKINPYDGEILSSIGGLNAPVGVAVGDDGTVYVSEALYGLPEGEGPPPEGFDPASVGRIVSIDTNGNRAYAQVTMPTGLLFVDGELYASAWALAGFFGMEDAGQVVKVHPKAFERHASAALRDGSGLVVGFVKLTEDATGTVTVKAEVEGLTPGLHGIHIHNTGSCTPPTFVDAGAHHNPLSAVHGGHAGDLPNLVVNPAGRGVMNTTTNAATLSPGPTTIFDANGSAVVVHALPDDLVTNPTGNSGGRVACGVLMTG